MIEQQLTTTTPAPLAGRLIALTEPSDPVRGLLMLSTGHIRLHTEAWLNSSARHELAWVSLTPNGWFVYVDAEANPADFPSDLIVCLGYARRLGCEYVLFDSEAARLDMLPFYITADGRWLNTAV